MGPLVVDDSVAAGGGAADDDDHAPPDRPVRFMVGSIGIGSPEDPGLVERCLLGFNAGPPIVPVSPKGRYDQKRWMLPLSRASAADRSGS